MGGLPVTFDVADVSGIAQNDKILLRWAGEDVAVLEASSIYKPDKVVEAKKFSAELGMTVTHYENMVYVDADHGYVEESVAKKAGQKIAKLSGTEFRRRLRAGEEVPEWFAFKSVVDILREAGDDAFC